MADTPLSRPPATQTSDGRLNSWKEISAYLGKDVRTAIRYAKDRGMPVHRVPGGKRGAVYAYAHELDAWLSNGAAKRQAVEPESARRAPWRWLIAAAGVAALAVTVLAARHWIIPENPVSVTLAASKLTAYGEDRRPLWSHQFPQPVREFSGDELARRVRLVDLDGDGRPEILAATRLTESLWRDQLWCFSSSGKLLWQYSPEMTLRSASRQYTGPWHFKDVVVGGSGEEKFTWVAVGHHTWWPSFIVRLEAAGRAVIQFEHSGSLFVLEHHQTPEGGYLLAGGLNNEYDSAILAVLKDDQAPAASPQPPGSRFRSEQPPAGGPYRYFLLPPTELHALVSPAPYNQTKVIHSASDGVQVWTDEENRGPLTLTAVYEFSAGLDPKGFTLGSGYRKVHLRLEREGKLHHTIEQCPERRGPKELRRWTPIEGWSDILVPAATRER